MSLRETYWFLPEFGVAETVKNFTSSVERLTGLDGSGHVESMYLGRESFLGGVLGTLGVFLLSPLLYFFWASNFKNFFCREAAN